MAAGDDLLRRQLAEVLLEERVVNDAGTADAEVEIEATSFAIGGGGYRRSACGAAARLSPAPQAASKQKRGGSLSMGILGRGGAMCRATATVKARFQLTGSAMPTKTIEFSAVSAASALEAFSLLAYREPLVVQQCIGLLCLAPEILETPPPDSTVLPTLMMFSL